MDDDRCENDEDRYGTVNFYEKDTDSSEEWGWRNDWGSWSEVRRGDEMSSEKNDLWFLRDEETDGRRRETIVQQLKNE